MQFLKIDRKRDLVQKTRMGHTKILIIGATGAIGKHVANASVKLGHPTFALVRSTNPSDPAKAQLLKSFQDAGVTLLVGDLSDKASLVAALKQVEVVISTVSGPQILSQANILEAAKEAGTIKRFLPSEFGADMDKLSLDVPVSKAAFERKLAIRRASEKSGIPYTFVASGAFADYYLLPLLQDQWVKEPPRDGKLVIWGDGNVKAAFVTEDDIGTFAVKSVDDPRAANKNLHIRPKENFASQNELTAVWEKKIGHTFEKEVLDKEGVLKSIGELPFPADFYRALKYHMLLQGGMWGELDPAKDVEASALYPDVKYTTIDQYFNRYVS